MDQIKHLVDTFASPSIGSTDVLTGTLKQVGISGGFERELSSMLSLRNGFMAFESSLHVFPVGDASQMGVSEWNAPSTWKSNYEMPQRDFFCFAENVFGEQFCFCDGEICHFDPETGDFERMTSKLDDWARMIVGDYALHTGYPLAHEWQLRNGPIRTSKRLIPKVPFVCGGEFSVDNLIEVEAVLGMRSRAAIANQIRDLPDGAQIQLDAMDK